MTATISELDRIEHLDFEAACDRNRCDATAEWVIAYTTICRKRKCSSLVCHQHLKAWREYIVTLGYPYCAGCGARFGVGSPSEHIIIDRIEPIR